MENETLYKLEYLLVFHSAWSRVGSSIFMDFEGETIHPNLSRIKVLKILYQYISFQDWAWASTNSEVKYFVGLAFGGASVAWSFYILIRALFAFNLGELWSSFTRFLWILGMYIWLAGILHDEKYPLESPVATRDKETAAGLLVAAFCLQGLYSMILKPKKVIMPGSLKFRNPFANCEPLKPDEDVFVEKKLRCTPLESFLGFSVSYRDIEHLIIFFWVGKDVAALYQIKGFWLAFYILAFMTITLLVNISLNTRDVLIDHCHYIALCIWMLGVFVYQMGHVWFHDQPLSENKWELWYPRHHTSEYMCEWYSKYIVLFAFVPIALLHIIWLGYFCISPWGDEGNGCCNPIRRLCNCWDPWAHRRGEPIDRYAVEENNTQVLHARGQWSGTR